LSHYTTEPLSRGRELLGEDSTINYIGGANSRLRIKMHGLPFNVNHMDAIEFSDIIRGLPYASVVPFSLKTLQSIELFSCYSGYGRRFSTGQVLANELRIPIKAFPHRISEAIKLRRPEWFRFYTPAASLAENDLATERHWTTKIHRRLHDFIAYVHNGRRPSRKKRLESQFRFYPPIYVELDLLIMREMTIQKFIRRHDLSDDAHAQLQSVLNSYHLLGDEDDDIIDQALLDILFSVDELRYLVDWLTAPPE
jgi:hypothetical protein